MNKTLFRRVGLALSAGLAALTLACGPAAAPATPAADPNKPVMGGTFRQHINDDMFNYDMTQQGSSVPNPYFIKLVYDSLLGRKYGADVPYGTTIVQPLLAESWEISPDATTYTFKLRKDVKFANVPPVNGRAFTSADVKFAYEYISRTGPYAKLPVAQFGFEFEGLDGVSTPDPYTAVVKFKQPFAPFLNYAASSDNPIMPHEIYDADGNFKDKIAGTGPFQPDFASSQQGSKWVMKKNPTYFKAGEPYLDQVDLLIIKDQATQLAAFKAKQLDFYALTDFRSAQEMQANNPDATLASFPYTPVIIGANLKRPPFDNYKVRQALSLSIDRDEALKITQGGKGGWAAAFSNVRDDLFTPEELKTFVKYDPELAKKVLADAGFTNGVSGELLYTTGNQIVEQQAQLLQSQWRKVGINMTLKPVDNNENVTRRRSRDFDILLLSEASYSDLDGSLNLAISRTGAFNYNQIDDQKVQDLLAAQRREVDPVKRNELLRQLVRHINESHNAIATWRNTQYMFTQPYLKNLFHNADIRTQAAPQFAWIAK